MIEPWADATVCSSTAPGDVAVLIPTLNEGRHIGGLLAQLVRTVPDRIVEILVIDGGSTDGTRAIASAAPDARVRLLDNPARLQAAGINLAARAAGPQVATLIRIDAHAAYPVGFVEQLLAAHAATGAESIVVRLNSVGETAFQRAVAAASNSAFGTGGAAHRSAAASGYVDHGHHALFDRATFERLGGYDEDFTANEDAEYDARLRQAGGRIWLAADAVVTYFPRATASALARQYLRYGRGRARTRLKHHERLRLRQMLPPALTLALATTIVLSPIAPALLIVPAAYLIGIGIAALILAIRTGDAAALLAVVALPVMHLSWGSGFLATTLAGRR